MRKFVVSAVLAAAFAGAAPAHAAIVLGGLNFDDNAFADAVVSSSGGIVFERQVTSAFDRVSTTPEDAVTGADLASSTIEMTRNQSMTIAFTDNSVVNGAGADFAIFELFGSAEFGNLTINGITLAINGVGSVTQLGSIAIPGAGFNNSVNYALIDLSDFGVAAGANINSFSITGSGSEYAAFGALNNGATDVPEPASLGLLGAGLLGLGFARRRRA